MTRHQRSKHHKGFFTRQPEDWNFKDFVKYIYKQRPNTADSIVSLERSIPRSWGRYLQKISSCDKKRCCTAARRKRAKELFDNKGSASDKSVIREVIQSLTNASSPVLNVQSMINVVNNGTTINGNQSATAGTDTTNGTAKDSKTASQNNNSHIEESSCNRAPQVDIASSDEEFDNIDSDTASDADQDTDQDTDEDGKVRPNASDAAFQHSYSSFLPERKWRLPSGLAVEDILYEAYNKSLKTKLGASIRNSIRNWILDVSNPKIQALFSARDWEAIKAEVKPLPDLDEHFVTSLERFDEITTTTALRKILATTSYADNDLEGKCNFHKVITKSNSNSDVTLSSLSPLSRGETREANPNTDSKCDFAQNGECAYDPDWAERVIRHFLILYERNTLNLTQCLERWYDCNVWSRVIDDCFLSIPNVILDRCELGSQSYLLRKNRDRTDATSRMKAGPRLDGILRDYPARNREFCVIESAPTLKGGTISTKWLSDKAKVRKLLRDMISRLDIEATRERRVLDDLQVFGISTAGLTLQVSRMSHPKGYVCLFVVDKEWKIPQDIERFRELLVFIAGMVRVKRAIANSIQVFKTNPSKAKSRSLREDLGTAFDNVKSSPTLPPIADSP